LWRPDWQPAPSRRRTGRIGRHDGAGRRADGHGATPSNTRRAAHGPGANFNYALLKGQARWLAGNPYQPAPKIPDTLAKLVMTNIKSMRFKPDHAFVGGRRLGFQAAVLPHGTQLRRAGASV